jgi:hypothetical protein
MRLSVLLLVLALAGMVGGAALIGRWAVGAAVIADSAAVAAWALLHDDGKPAAPVRPVRPIRGGVTLEEVLDEARLAP